MMNGNLTVGDYRVRIYVMDSFSLEDVYQYIIEVSCDSFWGDVIVSFQGKNPILVTDRRTHKPDKKLTKEKR